MSGEVFEIIGQATGDHFEDGVATQRFVVILILVIGEDAVNPLADHGNKAVSGEVRVTTIVESLGDLPGESDLFVELAHRNQATITGEGFVGDLDNHRFMG